MSKPVATIAASKEVYYALPGVPVQIAFEGTSKDQAQFTAEYIRNPSNFVVNKPSNINVETDASNKTITVSGVGDVQFTLNNLVQSDSTVVTFTVKCINLITVDENNVTIHDREIKALQVRTDILDVKKSITPAGIFTYSDGVITPIKTGRGTLTLQVKDTEKGLTQSVEVSVQVRDYVRATPLEILGARPFQIKGGDTLQIRVNKGETDTLSAETTEGVANAAGDIVSYTPPKTEVSKPSTVTVISTSTDGDTYREDIEVIVLPIDNVTLTVEEPVSVMEGETVELKIKTNATGLQLTPSVNNFTVDSTDRTVTGVTYGIGQITVRGTADGYLPTEKVINVTVTPAILSRPTLKTRVLTMNSGADLYLEFVVDKKGVLKVVEKTSNSTVEINKNIVKWTAPDIGVLPTKTFEFDAYVLREETNTESDKYSFNIIVNKQQEAFERDRFELSDIASVIKDDIISFEEKLKLIRENAPAEVLEVVTDLDDYLTVMNKSNSSKLTEEKGAEKQYKLFLTIRSIIETDDNDYFQVMFDLLNLYFKENKNEAFDEVLLSRFDTAWTYGTKALASFQLIAMTISILCDLKKRKNNLSLVDFNTVFDPQTTIWKEQFAQSVITYYTV